MDTPIPNDLNAFWMPFTPNRQFKADPRIIVGAKDMHYTTADGRRILDGSAGLWCVNAGHGRAEIAEAIAKQAATLDYIPNYFFGHPTAFEFANRIAALMPGDLDHVFFTNSGSESVDTALKIALAYQQASGSGSRRKLIGRARAYHGVGFGGISVGGITPNRKAFGSLLSEIDHLPHTHSLEHNAFTKGQPKWGAHLADELENLVALHGADTIAAVIVEPIAGSTGVLVPPVGYLERLREICDAYGILLIFDEVITGFGRLGAATATEKFNVMPDIVTTAKGLTNATVPMGAVIVREHVYEAFMQGPENMIELFHGYTYSGHPVAAAAGLATLDIYARDGLFERAAGLAGYWEETVHSLRGLNHVIDVRNFGMVAGIEMRPRDGAPGARAYDVLSHCYENGALIRITGDIIALSPPLIIDETQIEQLIEIVRAAIEAAA